MWPSLGERLGACATEPSGPGSRVAAVLAWACPLFPSLLGRSAKKRWAQALSSSPPLSPELSTVLSQARGLAVGQTRGELGGAVLGVHTLQTHKLPPLSLFSYPWPELGRTRVSHARPQRPDPEGRNRLPALPPKRLCELVRTPFPAVCPWPQSLLKPALSSSLVQGDP